MIQVIGTTYHLTQFERQGNTVQIKDATETASKKAVFGFCADADMIVVVALENRQKGLTEKLVGRQVVSVERALAQPLSYNAQSVLVEYLMEKEESN